MATKKSNTGAANAPKKQDQNSQSTIENKTNEMLKKHGVSVLYATSDGHFFFSAYAAKTHASTLEDKAVTEIRKTSDHE